MDKGTIDRIIDFRQASYNTISHTTLSDLDRIITTPSDPGVMRLRLYSDTSRIERNCCEHSEGIWDIN